MVEPSPPTPPTQLSPQQVLQAIIDNRALECKLYCSDKWAMFNPLENGVSIASVLNEYFMFRPYQEIITVGEISFPKPVSEAPEVGTEYWLTMSYYDHYTTTQSFVWNNDHKDNMFLQRCLIHLSKENAIEHSKALIKLSGGNPDD